MSKEFSNIFSELLETTKVFVQGSTWQSALAPDLPSDFPVARMRRLELNPLPNALDDSVNK